MLSDTVKQHRQMDINRRVAIPADIYFVPILEQLAIGGDVRIKVTGNSMWPFFAGIRDFVVLSPCDPDKLKKNDVILYKRTNGRYVLHRIIARVKGSYTLIGDNQTLKEPGVLPVQVLAVVKSVTRKNVEISCASFKWRFWSCLWTALLPIRHPLQVAMGAALKLRNKIFRSGRQ